MKKIFLALVIISIVSCTSKSGTEFTVQGKLKNSIAQTIYLEQVPEERERPIIIDSAKLDKDGSFTLHGTADEEGLYSLRTDQMPYPFAVFINDSKKISIEADLSKRTDVYTVSGSKATQSLLDFEKDFAPRMQQLDQFNEHYRELSLMKPGDSLPASKIDSLQTSDSLQFENTAADILRIGRKTIEESNSASLSMYVLYALAPPQPRENKLVYFTPTELKELVSLSAGKFNNSSLKNWQKQLGSTKAKEFTLLDTAGKAVSLSSFKGKYVLIDFWASWCQPCRMENPNVVAAYNQFKDKNFTILGVSLDDNKQAWLKAIHDDGLMWNQVSDLKGWDNEAAMMYGITGIPYNFLIDPDGNIVAENIRGQKLFTTLNSVLK